ncbi:MAG: NERD domain-containing protein, partial [Chloroflexota bacterium]|nr:NERD domain-containing protein [Chloroflexota bacterium]
MVERASRDQTPGERAEQLVVECLRAILPPPTAVLANVHWLLRDHGHVRKGEADVVIADPDRGILVLEVKSGEVRRDGNGTWWVGGKPLDRSPFQQASDSRYALIRKLYELPGWPAELRAIAGEAVAFPDVDLDTMRGRLGLVGLDAQQDLIADQSMFLDGDDARAEL